MTYFDSLMAQIEHYITVAFWCIFSVVAGILVIALLAKRPNRYTRPASNIKAGRRGEVSGIIFGRDLRRKNRVWYSPQLLEGHVAVYGGTGSGKTADILIPTLQSWRGTGIIIDLSGDIEKNCAQTPNKLVFDIEDADTVPYDVLWLIDREEDYRQRKLLIKELVRTIIPDPPFGAGDAAKYYSETAQKIFLAGFLILYEQEYDFIQICRMLYQNGFEQICSLVFQAKDQENYAEARGLLAPLIGSGDKNIAGAIGNMAAALEPFATNDYLLQSMRCTDGEDSRMSAINAGSCETYNVFVKIPEERLNLYGPILNLIVSQAFSYLKTHRKDGWRGEKVLFALDEFSAFGRMDILDALARLRKRGVRIMLLTQSPADIRLNYTEAEQMSLSDNFDAIVVLRATDPTSQKYFSDLVGTYEKIQKSRTRGATLLSGRESTLTDSETRERIIQPEEFGHLGESLVLIYRGGWKRLRRNHYYDVRGIRRKPEPAPEPKPEPIPRAKIWYEQEDTAADQDDIDLNTMDIGQLFLTDKGGNDDE